MVEQPRFYDIKKAITQGVQNMKKWYYKVDNTLAAYFICLGVLPKPWTYLVLLLSEAIAVLDPNVKNVYCCHCWKLDQYAAGMARLEEVVCQLPWYFTMMIMICASC